MINTSFLLLTDLPTIRVDSNKHHGDQLFATIYTDTPGVGPILRLPQPEELQSLSTEQLEQLLPYLRHNAKIGTVLQTIYQEKSMEPQMDTLDYYETQGLWKLLCSQAAGVLGFLGRYVRERQTLAETHDHIIWRLVVPTYYLPMNTKLLFENMPDNINFYPASIVQSENSFPDPELPERLLTTVDIEFKRFGPRMQREINAKCTEGIGLIKDLGLYKAAKIVSQHLYQDTLEQWFKLKLADDNLIIFTVTHDTESPHNCCSDWIEANCIVDEITTEYCGVQARVVNAPEPFTTYIELTPQQQIPL